MPATLQYVSPFEALGLKADDNLDKANLNLAKKRLLAELELSGMSTILRGSVELTKNDIINQFDTLAAVKNWDFHRLVAADKALLDFLQHKYWIINRDLKDAPQYSDAAFIKFVSPYFLFSYKSVIISYLASQNPKMLAGILKITPCLLTDDDHDDAWFSVESFLDGWKDNLNDMAENVKNGHVYSDNEVRPFYASNFIDCLNALPDDFSWFRDSYATSLYNISAYTWNKENYYRAIEMVKYAQLLDISEETNTMIQERITWFDAQIKTLGQSESTSWGTILRVFLFLIFFVTKVATCENSANNVNSNNKIISNVPRISAIISTDSLLRQAVAQKSDKTSKMWTKAQFDVVIKVIKNNQKAQANTGVSNNLLIEISLKELEKIEDMKTSKKTLTSSQIADFRREFKALK